MRGKATNTLQPSFHHTGLKGETRQNEENRESREGTRKKRGKAGRALQPASCSIFKNQYILVTLMVQP